MAAITTESPTKPKTPAEGGCGSHFLQSRKNRRRAFYPLFSIAVEPRFFRLRSLRGPFGPSHGPHRILSGLTKVTVLPAKSSIPLHRGLCFGFCPVWATPDGICHQICEMSSKILFRVSAWSFSSCRLLVTIWCCNVASRKVDFLCGSGSIQRMNANAPLSPTCHRDISFTIIVHDRRPALVCRWPILRHPDPAAYRCTAPLSASALGGNTPVITSRQVRGLCFWVILGVILGDVWGKCCSINRALTLATRHRFLRIWEGRMSSTAARLALIFAAIAFTNGMATAPSPTADVVASCGRAGLVSGRLANLYQAELLAAPD